MGAAAIVTMILVAAVLASGCCPCVTWWLLFVVMPLAAFLPFSLGIIVLLTRKRWNDDGSADEARRQTVARDIQPLIESASSNTHGSVAT